MKPMIYLAQPMGGRLWGEVTREARIAVSIVESYGFKGWAPPLKETTYANEWDIITSPPSILAEFWKQDVRALRRSAAVVSLRGDLVSEGVGYELGMAKFRYGLPIIVVSQYDVGRITHLEADYVAPNLDDACWWLQKLLHRKAARVKK